MPPTDVNLPSIPKPKKVVEGRVRCHKCGLLCRDAEHYLSHACRLEKTRDAGASGRDRSIHPLAERRDASQSAAQ